MISIYPRLAFAFFAFVAPLFPVFWDTPGNQESCEVHHDPVWATEQLICMNPCKEGCNRTTQVNTNSGHNGLICSCDIIGPPAVCCKLAYVPDDGTGNDAWELVGGCSMPGCGSNCALYALTDMFGDPIAEAGFCDAK